MEIPENARKEAQIKYEKKLRDVLGKVYPIFLEEKLSVNDINNIIQLVQHDMNQSVARMDLGSVIDSTIPKK